MVPRLLVVVAHADDESLWCGGTLLQLRDAGVALTVVCLSNVNHPVRAQEFRAACEMIGASAHMLDGPAGGTEVVPDFSAELDRICAGGPGGAEALVGVLTHAPHGNERGHIQHRYCYRMVRNWARGRGIPFGVFSERPLRYLARRKQIFRNGSLMAHMQTRTLEVRIVTTLKKTYRGMRRLLAPIYDDPPFFRTEEFQAARVGLVFTVDTARKRKLCENHASQMQGLNGYAALTAPFEYLYFDDMRPARAIISAMQAR